MGLFSDSSKQKYNKTKKKLNKYIAKHELTITKEQKNAYNLLIKKHQKNNRTNNKKYNQDLKELESLVLYKQRKEHKKTKRNAATKGFLYGLLL